MILYCRRQRATQVALSISGRVKGRLRQQTVVSADVRRRAGTMRRIASRVHLGVGALHRNQRHFWYFWCQKYTGGSSGTPTPTN